MNSDGSIYAGRGAILPDDDPVALKHINMVVAVHGDADVIIPKPTVVLGAEPVMDDLSAPPEEEEEDPQIWSEGDGFRI